MGVVAKIDPAAGATARDWTVERPEISLWNDYWRFDRLSSFDVSGANNYRDDLGAGWHAFFENLPDGATILDLCTGNGAIAVIAASVSRRTGRNFRITAIDAADINPCRHVTRHRDELATIDFRPATPIERIPFPDAHFDAVVSQYGIEYSDTSRSVPEVARVVAPGGRVRLVMHAAEGVIVARSATAIPDIDFLLHEVDLAGKAQDSLRAVGLVERGPPALPAAQAAARASCDALQKALDDTHRRSLAAADRTLLWEAGKLLTLLHQRRRDYDLAEAIGIVEEMRSEWRNHRARLVAQVEAAVAREDRAGIADALRRAGAAKVGDADERAADGLLGHRIDARF